MNKMMSLVATGFIVVFTAGCAGSHTKSGTERVVESSAPHSPAWGGQVSVLAGKSPSDTLWATGRADQVAELDAGVAYASAMGVGVILDYIQINAVKVAEAAYSGNSRDPGGKFLEYAIAWRSKVKGLTGIVTPEVFWQRVEVEGTDAIGYYYRVQTHSAFAGKEYRDYLRNALEGIRSSAQSAKDLDAASAADKALQEVPE